MRGPPLPFSTPLGEFKAALVKLGVVDNPQWQRYSEFRPAPALPSMEAPMRCPSCGQDYPQGASFCEECGAKLQPTCPSCGSEVRGGARFCRSCGAVLTPPPTAPPSVAGQPLAARQTPSPHPTSFVNGRYQVVRFLGEGGKKRVYWPTMPSWTGTWPSPSSRPRT
jgi:hypothetical protein